MPKDTLELPERVLRVDGTVVRAEHPSEGEEDERTVELSFSSEEPYERFFGVEILGHGKDEVDLSWIGSGRAPLLVDHRAGVDHQVGRIERAWIEGGVGRAAVRFGKSARASEVLARVRDGELTAISVGYRVSEMKLIEEHDDQADVYRVTDWKPLEVSLVSIPADPTVGVGRDGDGGGTINVKVLRNKEVEMTEEQKRAAEVGQQKPPAAPAISDDDRQKALADVQKAERERIAEIEAVGARFNIPAADRAKAIKDGVSVAEFRGAVLDRLGDGAQQVLTNTAMVGLTPREVQRFSFVRALRALANPRDHKIQEAAKFEFEVSEEAVRKTGSSARGIMVPVDVLRTPMADGQRDLTVGTATAGGHTVSTDLLAASFIDLLRNRMMVQRLGATVLNDLRGDVAIPRQTGGASAFWVAESGAVTESQQAFDQVALAPKTLGAWTDISRKLLLQSSIDVEAFVRGDIATVIALEIDRASLHGSGASNQPTGIAGTSGIGSVSHGTNGGAPTWATMVQLETEVSVDNADMGALAYLTNAKVRGTLKTTEKASGTGLFLMQEGRDAEGFEELNGYRAGISNQVRSDLTKGTGTDLSAAFFGNWADLIIGMWSGLDLTVDPFTNATSGTVRVVGLQDVDVAVRHAESFSAALDIITN